MPDQPEVHRLKFIREDDDELTIGANQRVKVLRVSMGGNKRVGFYFTFRGDPEEIVELTELMAQSAKQMLPRGSYKDNRSRHDPAA